MCKPDPEQTDVVKTWQAPRDVAQLSSFLGFANYYREFIKGYADIAAPLSRLNRNNATWQWGEEEQSEMYALKEILTCFRKCVLAHFTIVTIRKASEEMELTIRLITISFTLQQDFRQSLDAYLGRFIFVFTSTYIPSNYAVL